MIISAVLPGLIRADGTVDQQALRQLLTELRYAGVTLWWSSPTADRPVDPVLGQIIYDTDTLQVLYCSAIRDHAIPAVWTAFTTGGAGTGTVTSIGADDPIIVTPDPITVAGVVSHATSGVTPGTYGDSANVAQITVNDKGHITAATEVAIPGGGGAPVDASYVVMSLNGTLTQERALTEGLAINITDNGANNTVVVAVDFSGLAFGWFGSGQDGVVHFNGTNTFSFATLTGSIYYLHRAVHATDCTIDVGIAVTGTNWTTTFLGGGQQIYCQGTFTCNGTWHQNGNTNTVNKNIGGLGGGNQGGVQTLYGVGSNGGNGTTGTGLNGVALTACLGGTGGNGGTGIGGTAGLAGTNTPPDEQMGAENQIYAPAVITSGRITNIHSSPVTPFWGGTGGGGGGGVPASGFLGGGAGGGGGVCGTIARYMAGTGTISADGGAGNNGDHSLAGRPAGGGGGGGGGIVLILTTTAGIISILSIHANGGTGGTAVSPGTAGVNGSPGRVIITTVTA